MSWKPTSWSPGYPATEAPINARRHRPHLRTQFLVRDSSMRFWRMVIVGLTCRIRAKSRA